MSKQPRAEIIIAKEPPRATRLAAAELQTYVEKISGARLPIATEPSANIPVQVYIGRSTHTEKLGITGERLDQGSYRVVSGENWLVLIGDDTDFTLENYPFTGRGFYLPPFVARTIGKSINATKGISRGEDIWLSFRQDFDTLDIGFNHFQMYFTARMY